MVLKNDYGKEFIKVNENEIIYKGILRKCIIKRADIRSVFYDESILGILTYSGKIYSLNINSLLFSERSKLEELRQELSKENILFNYTKYVANNAYSSLIFFINPIIKNLDKIEVKLIILILIIVFIAYKVFYINIIFNIDKEEFEIIKRNSTIKYKKYQVDKINLKKYTNDIYMIEFEKDRKKYNLLFRGNPYLMKIYNVSLVKLFG
jgi:hypothetical protein